MATFNTDTLVAQGYDHREIGCQDYALSGVEKDYAYAIVCDGCSGSKGSDVGARLIATTAAFVADAIYNETKYDFSKLTSQSFDYPDIRLHYDRVLKWTIREGWFEHKKSLRELITENIPKDMLLSVLGTTCLDATLVLAVVTQNDYHAFIWGDGAVVVETGDGLLTTEVNFPSGCPYYLSYTIDKGRKDAYFSELGADATKLVTTSQVGATLPESSSTRSIPVADPVYITGPTSNLKNISVMSDGMTSFMNISSSIRIPFQEIWKMNFDFNGFGMNGKFLKRKHNLLNRWLKIGNIVHLDDLSVSTIHVKQ